MYECLLNIFFHAFGEMCGTVFLATHDGVEGPEPRHELEIVDRLERNVQRALIIITDNRLGLVLPDAIDEMIASARVVIAEGKLQFMALWRRDLGPMLDGARRLNTLHEVDAVRLRNREALRDSAALADGEQVLAARFEVRDEPQRDGHDTLAAIAEMHGAALHDAAGKRVKDIVV